MRFAAVITSLILAQSPLNSKPVVTVLCYHGLGSSKNRFSFLYSELKFHLKYLKSKGFAFVSFDNLINGRVKGTKNIIVSVDDGKKSFYRAYYEIFKPMGIKPLIAIYPSVISRKNYALTWKQVKKLSDEGCEIASHGYNHRFINNRLYRFERRNFIREIYKSKKILENKTGKKINIFVYPYGARSPLTIKEVKEAGYKYAFTVEARSFQMPPEGSMKVYELPRYMITRFTQNSSFAKIIRGAGEDIKVYAAQKKNSGKRITAQKENRSSDVAVKKTEPGNKKYSGLNYYFTDRYHAFNKKEKILFINYNFNEAIFEPDTDNFNYSQSFNPGPLSRKISLKTEPLSSGEIIELSYNSASAAFNAPLRIVNAVSPALNDIANKKGSVFQKFKAHYHKIIRSSFEFYEKWPRLINKKVKIRSKKISQIWDNIFS